MRIPDIARLLSLLIALSIVFSLCACGGVSQGDYEALQNEFTTLESNYEQSRAELEKVQIDYEQARAEIEKVQGDYKQTETELEIVQSDYEEAQAELEKVQGDYEQTKAELDKLQTDYSQLKQEHDSLVEETADWMKLTEEEKAAELAQAEAARIKAEEAEKKAKEEQEAAERAAAEEAAKKAEEEAAKKAEEEKKGYDTGITYDNLARDPDKYKGEKVKFRGKVLQVVEMDSEVQIRLATNGSYDDVVYLYFDKSLISSRILEDDKITIYGVAKGLHSYKTVMGATVTLPLIQCDKIDT